MANEQRLIDANAIKYTERKECGGHGLYFFIAHGVTVQEWISVKDRLPEVGDSYLVVVKYKYDHEKEYNYDTDVATYYPYDNPSAYIDERWDTYNDWDEGQQYLHITHWMPLPQPPKGE